MGIPNHALLQRLNAIDMPVFVANGDSDRMILPHYSYLLAGLIPQAQVKIPRLSTRVPVPAPRRVRHRCPGIPYRRQLSSRRSHRKWLRKRRASLLALDCPAAC